MILHDVLTLPALFVASHLYSPASSTWQSFITSVNPLTDWLMSNRPPALIGLSSLNHWKPGSGVPIARHAKRTELPSIADLSRSLRINSGSLRRSFGFAGSGLDFGSALGWGFGAGFGGGSDFSTWAVAGEIEVSITGSGFLETSVGFDLEARRKVLRLTSKISTFLQLFVVFGKLSSIIKTFWVPETFHQVLSL